MTRPDSLDLVYLDSSVLIRYIQRGDGWGVVDRLLRAAEANQFQLLSSPLLLVECLGQNPGPMYDAGVEARMRDRLDNPRLIFAEFSHATALRARQLHLNGTVKETCDVIYLASAIENEADVLFTFDVDDFPVGQRIDGVWVDAPYFPGDEHNLFST